MIRNYNGEKDRRVMMYLRRICDVHEENLNLLMRSLKKDGVVLFYRTEDFFTDCLDEASGIVALYSEEEIKSFLKVKFAGRVDYYIRTEGIINDYFIETLVNFLKKNKAVFPGSKEMEEIEKEAEELRIAATQKKGHS